MASTCWRSSSSRSNSRDERRLMRVIDTDLPGVRIFEPERFEDERGWLMELWNEERYGAAGLDVRFVQTNVSWSRRGVLRGLHYQTRPHAQGKLITVPAGAIFDVVVDLRQGSPTFARWYGCELSHDNGRQLWVPEGFAHGFLVLSDAATVHYGCTTPHRRAAERSIAWDDPDIAIQWPAPPLTISARDAASPRLRSVSPDALLVYSADALTENPSGPVGPSVA